MTKFTRKLLAGGLVAAFALAAAPVSAAPAMAPVGIVKADAVLSVDKVAYRRVYRTAPRAYYRRRGVGPAVGLGIAAGVLGAVGAAAAASNGYYYGAPAYGYPAYGYGGCYITKQAAYDPWGNFAGWQRVRVCN